jgi:putative transcriptional regulator
MGYHYTESGLDYVYLENGYTIHDTPYGKGVSIQNTERLHRALADCLVDLPRPLNGAELRFLRIELEMSQRNLAEILGTTEQTYRRWEKARTKDIDGSADRLLRALYKEYAHGKSSVRQVVERMATLDLLETRPRIQFRETAKGWQSTECCDA